MITVCYNWFTPAYKAGGPSKSLLNLTTRLKTDTQIRVFCSAYDIDGTPLPVKCDAWELLTSNIYVWYSGHVSILKWIKVLRQQRNTVCYINGIYSLKYNLLPLLIVKAKKIVAPRGMLDPAALKKKSFKKSIYLTVCKKLFLLSGCTFQATSKREAEHIQDYLGNKIKIAIIPNLPSLISYKPMPLKAGHVLKLTTIALVGPMKNYLLVLKALKRCTVTVQYNIFGPVIDFDYWDQCMDEIRLMPPNVKVLYHGELEPGQVEYQLSQTHVYIQPSESENFGHSLYEALASGRPVITSNNTPWTNLQSCNAGFNVEINNEFQIKEAIERFAGMSEQEMNNWGVSAKLYAERSIDNAAIVEEYCSLFELQQC